MTEGDRTWNPRPAVLTQYPYHYFSQIISRYKIYFRSPILNYFDVLSKYASHYTTVKTTVQETVKTRYNILKVHLWSLVTLQYSNEFVLKPFIDKNIKVFLKLPLFDSDSPREKEI